MATNEFEPEPVPTRAQQLERIFGTTKSAIAGSDYPLRVVVLFVMADLFVFLGQFWNWATPIALVCLMALSLSWPRKRG